MNDPTNSPMPPDKSSRPSPAQQLADLEAQKAGPQQPGPQQPGPQQPGPQQPGPQQPGPQTELVEVPPLEELLLAILDHIKHQPTAANANNNTPLVSVNGEGDQRVFNVAGKSFRYNWQTHKFE